MALAPCLLGYGAIAQRLYSDKRTRRDENQYWKWIVNYVADDYTIAVKLGSGKKKLMVSATGIFSKSHLNCVDLLEEHMQKVSLHDLEELVRIFVRATELEIKFWDMGLNDKSIY